MRLIIILLLALGICFRFVNLDHKVYWFDETFTSLRSAGYTEAEIVQHFAQTSVVNAVDLQQYQQPDRSRGIRDTLYSLAIEDTQHPPLYYVLANVWMRSIGSSVSAMRLLSVLLSLLVFPCAYWLCWELFVARGAFPFHLPAWIMIGLLAISPFQVLYAQESRQYGLWSVTTLLATAALLRAVRLNRWADWGIYALTLTIGCYTFLFTGLVAIAHGSYILMLAKFRPTKTAMAYLIASLIGIAAFSPWMGSLAANLSHVQTVTSWTGNDLAKSELLRNWIRILGRLFFDQDSEGNDGNLWIDRPIKLGSFVLVIGAFYWLCRRTPKSVWLLMITLAGIPFLALALADLILGGLRSTYPRYFIPTLLAVQLAVAYLLSVNLVNASSRFQPYWRGIAAIVFGVGICSCILISQSQVWWIKIHNTENPAVVQVLQHTAHPLLISDAKTGDLLSLSHSLPPTIDLVIRPRCSTCHHAGSRGIDPSILQIPEGYEEVFLYHPRASKEWRRSLAQMQNYRAELISLNQDKVLWRIVRNLD
ncbi:MAG: hypothetical protein HC865_20515 [Cyanobacteria bacterium RU_5_0]|nr:hypothetical protein [Cyanobacteria bacterium RU_5_0]